MAEEITLEALEAQAAAELKAEAAVATADPEAQGGAESKESAEQEGAGAEQAAQNGKQKVEVPVAKLAKLRESRREAREEAERLQRQNEELLKQLSLAGAKQAEPQPQIPTLESCGYDESKYQAELAQWVAKNTESQLQQIQQKQLQEQRRQLMQQQLENEVHAHYKRVESLGVQAEEFIPAEQAVRDTFGDAAVDQMIAAIGEGSERVVYHLGLNATEREKIGQLIQLDPTGLRAMAYIGQLNARLASQPAQKTISQAPAADRPLTGSKTADSASSVVKKLQRLDGMADRSKFREFKRQLIAAGQAELLRKHGYL